MMNGKINGVKNPSQLTFFVEKDVHQKLVAIAYLQNKRGMYSFPTRDFINAAVEKFIQSLDADKRRDFEEILRNVVIQFENRMNEKIADLS